MEQTERRLQQYNDRETFTTSRLGHFIHTGRNTGQSKLSGAMDRTSPLGEYKTGIEMVQVNFD